MSNHKSIRSEQELVLLPAYDKSRPVVPVAAIYGANASGKSNFIDALMWMRGAVIRSFSSWRTGKGVPRAPFKLDPGARNEPSEFAIDVVVEGVRYHYGFAVDDERILAEWLYSYPKGRRRVIFERTGQEFAFGSTVAGHRDLVAEMTEVNALFLSVASRSKIEPFGPLYWWFMQTMVVDGFDGLEQLEFGLADEIELSRENAHGATEALLVDLIRAADFGITDVVLTDTREEDLVASFAAPSHPLHGATLHARDDDSPNVWHVRMPSGEIRPVMMYPPPTEDHVLFRHGDQGAHLRLAEQSDGTRAWIEVALSAVVAFRRGGVMIIDELDQSLHPRLTARLIELFHDQRTNPRSAQLIFTTHDAALLGTSLGAPVLNRDEIWFVEKGADGCTSLFPLTDFQPRKDENTERRYLGGSYGAVPMVFSDSLVEQVTRARGEQDDAAS